MVYALLSHLLMAMSSSVRFVAEGGYNCDLTKFVLLPVKVASLVM